MLREQLYEAVFTKKNQELYLSMHEEVNGFGNGHYYYMITNLTRENLNELLPMLKEYEGTSDYFSLGNGRIDKGFQVISGLRLEEQSDEKYVIEFDTSNNGYTAVIEEISKTFPFAHCYYCDCWDHEEVVGCLINGEDASDCYQVTINEMSYSEDYTKEDWEEHPDDICYDIRGTLLDLQSGSSFEIGGGYLSLDQAQSFCDMARIELDIDSMNDYLYE